MPVNMMMQRSAQQKREEFAPMGHGQESLIATTPSGVVTVNWQGLGGGM
jgi:hypothetical protein